MGSRSYYANRKGDRDIIPKGFAFVPSVIQHDGTLMLRGSPEWNQREQMRKIAGCCCLSFNTLRGNSYRNNTE